MREENGSCAKTNEIYYLQLQRQRWKSLLKSIKRLLTEYLLKLLWVTLEEKIHLLKNLQENEIIKGHFDWHHNLIYF